MATGALLGAICGALAAGIARLFVRDVKAKRTAYLTVTLLLFAILFGAGRTLVRPHVRAWQARSEAEVLLRENRLFAVLASRHPEVREGFTNLIVEGARRGASRDEAYAKGVAWGQTLIRPYFERYAPQASGESLARFVSATVEVLDDLAARDIDGCHAWLSGRMIQAGRPAARISKAHQDRVAEAMGGVVESAIQDPQRPPDASQAQAAVQALVQTLMAKHGPEFSSRLAVLGDLANPNVNREVACSAAREAYREALLTPEPGRAVLLRSLFSTPASRGQ